MKINQNELEKYFISASTSFEDALKRLEKTGHGILLVVDSEKVLLGTITDGDIRRGILKNISFEKTCESILNPDPYYGTQNMSYNDIKRLFDVNPKGVHLDHIPIVDENKRVMDLAMRQNYMTEDTKDAAVVIMAGGLGKRLLPLTLERPKPLMQVTGKKSVLQLLLETYIGEGFKNFIISLNYKAEMIKKEIGYGERFGVNIDYVTEKERLGTAGPLSLMTDKLTEPFFVINSDIITKVNFTNLLKYHIQMDSDATLCVRNYEHQVPYGVVELSDQRLVHIKEKPSYNYFVSTGMYVLSPNVLNFIPKNTYYDMDCLLTSLLSSSCQVNSYPIHEYWLDIGRYEDLKKAEADFEMYF